MEQVEQLQIDKLQQLRLAWRQGLDSGAVGDIDFSALRREAKDIMPRVSFTAQARQDLLDIWLFIAPRNGETVAERVYSDI